VEVPAAQTVTEEPVTGCWPPKTFPERVAGATWMGLVGLSPMEQPARRARGRLRKARVERRRLLWREIAVGDMS
jgi:hypothetical protein